MSLNFTGRDPGPPLPPPAQDRSFSAFAAACLVLAGLVALAAVLILLNRPKPSAALPPLSGTTLVAAEPARPPAPTPAAAPAPPPPALAPAQQPVAQPKARPDHKALFLAPLRRSGPGAITLAVEDEAGAQAYGRQLSDLFREAGWTVTWTAVFGSDPAATGLSAALGRTAQDLAVRDAFASAGVTLGPPPATGIVQTPELFVGAPRQAPLSAGPAPPSP